jgi:osmotically-inducible protein OsmY
MKKLTTLLLSGVLLLSTVACQNAAKTSSEAPDSTQERPQAPNTSEVQDSKNDAQSQTRRKQLNADIRAREQRNNLTGGDTKRAEGDLESEVRSKLEANIPKSQLTIDATEDGTVTVSGSIPNQQDLKKIQPLAMQIKGVKKVVNKVVYTPPKAEQTNNTAQ